MDPVQKKYLVNQEALSLVFRGNLINYLACVVQRGKLSFGNGYLPFKRKLYTLKWVVSVRQPITKPHLVIEYIARYTHQVAIANSLITDLNHGMVTFNTKDRKTNKTVPVTVKAVEFIRQFLLHSLPSGFVRIRHYGFLANKNHNANLQQIRGLLKLPSQLIKATPPIKVMMLKLTGVDITKCPCCKSGKIQLVAEIPMFNGKHQQGFIRPPTYQTAST